VRLKQRPHPVAYSHTRLFQYQKGAIKTLEVHPSHGQRRYFNTKKVRLKLGRNAPTANRA